MATQETTVMQLDLDGTLHPRTVFRFEPGEYERLRNMVVVQTCEICERIQTIAARPQGDNSNRGRYSWKHWYFASPWDEEETLFDMVCDDCGDKGRNDGSFAPEYCDHCNRYIIQRNPSNGYRNYFTLYQEEMICVRCYQEEMMEHGITDEDVEDGHLSCDFYTESELRDAGFDEGRTFTDFDKPTLLAYVAAVRSNGSIVLFDQGRTSIIGGPDSVTAWTREARVD